MRTLFLSCLLVFSIAACNHVKVELSVNECHESACTDLKLYKNGAFDLDWSFPSSESPSHFYSGQYLVLSDCIFLYTDSSFDSSMEFLKLKKFKTYERISIENRSRYPGGFKWLDGKFKPIWPK